MVDLPWDNLRRYAALDYPYSNRTAFSVTNSTQLAIASLSKPLLYCPRQSQKGRLYFR